MDTYDDIREYIDEEKQKRYCLNKALELAEQQETTTMSDNDVVEAARKFNEFIKED